MNTSTDNLPGLLGALLVGVALGYGWRWAAEPEPEPPPAPVVEVKTETKEVVVEDTNRLEAAQQEVRKTKRLLAEKDLEILELAGRPTRTEDLANARRDLAELRIELSENRRVRDERMKEFDATLKTVTDERERAVSELASLKELSTEVLWTAFVDNAKTRICDRGTRGRMDRCHAAVVSSLKPHRAQFMRCAEGADRIPTLFEQPLDRDPGKRARRVKDSKEFTRHGWAVLYCSEPGDSGL